MDLVLAFRRSDSSGEAKDPGFGLGVRPVRIGRAVRATSRCLAERSRRAYRTISSDFMQLLAEVQLFVIVFDRYVILLIRCWQLFFGLSGELFEGVGRDGSDVASSRARKLRWIVSEESHHVFEVVVFDRYRLYVR